MEPKRLDKLADELASKVDALRVVAKAFPNAVSDRLWDGGPHVPVVYTDNALDIATGVHLATEDGTPILLPYVEVGAARVYLMPGQWLNINAQNVLSRLPFDVLRAAMKEEC